MFLLTILCSLWDFGKIHIDPLKKNFATFVDTALLNGGLNQVIFRDLFFGFSHWFLGYFTSTLKTLLFRVSLYSHFGVLNISSLERFFNSLSWMEFRVCFMTFGGWFDKVYKVPYLAIYLLCIHIVHLVELQQDPSC